MEADVKSAPEEFVALQQTFALMSQTKCSWIETFDFVKLFRSKMPTSSTQQVKRGQLKKGFSASNFIVNFYDKKEKNM